MKLPLCFLSLVFVISTLRISAVSHVERTQNSTVINNFLACLKSHSDPSFPILNTTYTPTNPSFSFVLEHYVRNSRFNRSTTPKPHAIVAASHVSHVQAAIICSKSSGLQVRIRSGGHDFDGLSYVASVPFIILDMFNLRAINVDIKTETVWVQAGALLGELYYSIINQSQTLAFPSGVCLSLAAGGHFSGGGYGNMLRQYGLSVDHIVDAQVVDANGELLNRATMGEDLFWAIRGGGGASFCVILAWKIQLVRIPEIVTVFNIQRTLEQHATDIILEWQEVAPMTDRKFFLRVQPQAINNTVQVSFIGFYLGQADDLFRLTNKSFPLLGLRQNDSVEMSWGQSILYWNDNSPKGTPLNVLLQQRIPTGPHSYHKHKSDYVKKPIPREGIEAIWKKMLDLNQPLLLMQWNPYGGRMSEIPAAATPFPHRYGNLFKIQHFILWQDDSKEAEDQKLKALDELYETFTPYVSRNPREAFLNYRDIDIGTNVNGNLSFAFDYFKDNVKRLQEVKAKVDPGNFFMYQQSIPLVA